MRVRERLFLGGGVFFFALVAVMSYAIAPDRLVNEASVPALGEDLDAWLAAAERVVSDDVSLIPEAEKRILWFGDSPGSKTPISVVYLHGFSATRQEVAPVSELVADALGANLFETRLRGHGQRHRSLEDVRAEDWLEDAAEALAIGAAIGETILLMGTSTGATLALAMQGHETFEPVRFLVLMSPNLALRDSHSEFLTWPGGPQLARLLVGETRSWTPANALQGRYWSTSYPTDALVEMMRLVKFVRGTTPAQPDRKLLVFYSPEDQVVDADRIEKTFLHAGSRLIEISASRDPGKHVLAGDIMAPENNRRVVDEILAFVNSVVR